MKRLKKFEAFAWRNIESQELDDILVELRDRGFWTRIDSYRNAIQIEISKQDNSKSGTARFVYADIEDVVERIKSYLAEEGLFYSEIGYDERRNGIPNIKTSIRRNHLDYSEVTGTESHCLLTFIKSEEE